MSPTAFAVLSRPLVLLIPRSQTLTCLPNAANPFACHRSEKPVAKFNHCHTSKIGSRKSFVCHTSETPGGPAASCLVAPHSPTSPTHSLSGVVLLLRFQLSTFNCQPPSQCTLSRRSPLVYPELRGATRHSPLPTALNPLALVQGLVSAVRMTPLLHQLLGAGPCPKHP